MRFKYSSDVPRNVRKAFAERVRQARIHGGGEEYEEIMKLKNSSVEITEEVARFALRKNKVSRETFKTAEEQFLDRVTYWKKHGLEASNRFQYTMKMYKEGKLKDISKALPRLRGHNLKVERLNALLEETKEYIYDMASVGDEASNLLLNNMTDENKSMFDKDTIDDYIRLIEEYKENRYSMVERYNDYVNKI